MAFSVLAAGSMVSIACGGADTSSASTGAGGSGGGTTTATSTTGTGGVGGSATTTTTTTTTTGSSSSSGSAGTGGGPGCTTTQTVAYDACDGTSFFPDGTCLAGECATIPLETRVYKEWRSQVKALSGYSDAQLDARVKVAEVSHSGGPDQVFVSIDYVVVIDWVRSRQHDSPQLGNFPLMTAPTDAEITSAVTIGIEKAEWTGLAAIAQVAPEPATQLGFDTCACDMKIDFCHIDFENVTGKLRVRAIKEIDAAKNECKKATVTVDAGMLDTCIDTPCAIN